ncbi:phage tail protein [Brevundimonas vitis]|uniref:Phage tail protein n=1 Tax=Brevundimonas vitisensis TaxID=2800818 RepID=A0ABX7BTP0_9CAUL|nr:tail fiber protein [Brevundimonas vitisensis]QQQ19469.1 phage tail protein [Brevundimonas vitisensis]
MTFRSTPPLRDTPLAGQRNIDVPCFLGEIRAFPYDRVPAGWRVCDGALLRIQDYPPLFALLRNRYGGNGISEFALPDLRGRTPVGIGSSDGHAYSLGEKAGEEAVYLSEYQVPTHTHALRATTDVGNTGAAKDNLIATVNHDDLSPPGKHPLYGPAGAAEQPLLKTSIRNAGGGGAHDNIQPSLVLRYCIAMEGVPPLSGTAKTEEVAVV